MCGIAGIASPTAIDERLPQAFLRSLRHRGPDDEGIYIDPKRSVALTHTRLSILDLSSAGHQPMPNEDETLWITYNGEIYNFQELRQELLAKGHSFRSRTDTEVILHLYEEEGEALVQRLIGIFAFALYDKKKHRLFLARDRLGVKPLYYVEDQGRFLFASEIKALLATDLFPIDVNWQGIWDYFTFAFVPHPHTAFQKILQLPPAHTLTFDLTTRQSTLRRYWTPWAAQAPRHASYPALREQVRDLVNESVRSELVSDVPLGVFFSGGIDSTILTALMIRHSKTKVKTFTVVFRGTKKAYLHDDSAYARLASKALGTEHHELPVDLHRPEEFLQMVRHVDQPFGNPTLYLQYLIAKATRQHVTVALSGVGGDELFGGYPKYRPLPMAPLLSAIPPGVGQLTYRLLNLVREDTWIPVLRRAKRLLKGVGYPLADQYLRWSYYLSEGEKRELLHGLVGRNPLQPATRIIREAIGAAPPHVDRYGKVFSAELATFLAGNLLEYTDKATMAVALETRVPFLDHRLVELSTQIPFRDKIHWGRTKVILIDAFKDVLPKTIVKAPKRGFSPPIAEWLEKVLDHYFDDVLTKRQIQRDGIFSWESLQALRAEHRKRRRDASIELVTVLMFDVWYRHYILKQLQWD